MSAICSPESATASLTAVKAWAASGMSAERVTLEKPTPLIATLHRFSHMAATPREAELRQCDAVVQFLENHLDAPADLGLGIFRLQQIAGQQSARRIVEFDDD